MVRSGRRWRPALGVVVVEQVAHLRPRARGHRKHRGDDPVGSALDQIPDQGTADAEAENHEAVDAEMIHQRKLIVGMRIPGPVDLERAAGLAGRGIAQVVSDAAVFVPKLLHGVEGRIVAGDPRDVRVQSAARD
jgi:hypothetical protein